MIHSIQDRRTRTRISDYENLVRRVELRHGIDRQQLKPFIVARNPPGFRWRRLAVFLGILAGLVAWWWAVVVLVHWVWRLSQGISLVSH